VWAWFVKAYRILISPAHALFYNPDETEKNSYRPTRQHVTVWQTIAIASYVVSTFMTDNRWPLRVFWFAAAATVVCRIALTENQVKLVTERLVSKDSID
jgi:hypothetical protein